MPLPQERLIGERVVVKEIEIFGNFWHPTVGADIGGAGRMALCEKSVAQIEQMGGEAWANLTDVMG
jgi:hypothetical protein